MSKFVLLAVLVALVVPAQQAAAQDFNMSLSCAALPLVADGFLGQHVSGAKADDAFAKQVAKIWAEALDPTETLLTQAEYDKLETRLFALTKAVRERECSDFTRLKQDQVAWQTEMAAHVKKVVGAKGFKINKKRELELDSKKRDRPKTTKERDKLRRALIDFQMANYLASDVAEKEAREKLIHRYELFTKRITEQTEADLYGLFLNAYAAALDPHSTYFSPEDMEDFRIQMQLSLTGIGAVLSSRDGYTVIEEIVPGGAADDHGKLRPKDQIIAVAQGDKGGGEVVDVIDMDLRDVVRLIRGKKGTKVTLTVLRKGTETERFEFTIVRDVIDLAESAAKLTWQTVKRGERTVKVAVIDLPSFYMGDKPGARDSAVDVARLIAEAKQGKADAMVLDLSRNGGGVLQSAVSISGLFIERGAVVAASQRNQKTPEILEDKDPDVQWGGPLVILTSKVSASASEILAGALSDYHRAVIVGDEHTYGKGSVQQLSQLPPGLGMMKITTALYYLPGGQSTQSAGVRSDVLVPSAFSTLEIGEKHQPHALAPSSTKKFISGLANKSKKWQPVNGATVKGLASKSQARVAASKEFKELRDKLAKSNPNETKIKISEILDDKKKSDSEAETPEEKKKKEELSIQAKEAAEIAADLAVAP